MYRTLDIIYIACLILMPCRCNLSVALSIVCSFLFAHPYVHGHLIDKNRTFSKITENWYVPLTLHVSSNLVVCWIVWYKYLVCSYRYYATDINGYNSGGVVVYLKSLDVHNHVSWWLSIVLRCMILQLRTMNKLKFSICWTLHWPNTGNCVSCKSLKS